MPVTEVKRISRPSLWAWAKLKLLLFRRNNTGKFVSAAPVAMFAPSGVVRMKNDAEFVHVS